jgi:hypothetical protein
MPATTTAAASSTSAPTTIKPAKRSPLGAPQWGQALARTEVPPPQFAHVLPIIST